MATLEQIMQGIEARLATIDGLRVSDTIPGQINPPQAVVGVPVVDSYVTGLNPHQRPALAPTITVLVSSAVDRVGQLALAAYADPVGDRSIPAAIAADASLGGLLGPGACQVTRFDPLNYEEVGLIGYFGGRFSLRIIT
jgi:hypothetical protein